MRDSARGAAFSLSGRPESKVESRSPGPGAYDIGSPARRQRATISGRWRDFKGDRNPGPGDYSPRRQGGSGGFTFGSRTQGAKISETPGPGAYGVSSPRPKGLTMGARCAISGIMRK